MAAMLSLSEQDIPTYPVHDCLLCRQSDQGVVVKALQEAMMNQIRAVAVMDVESLGAEPRLIIPDELDAPH